MSAEEVDDQYFTHEGRLASFQKSSKKRGSTAAGRGAKALNWPHKQIAPASLAKAGFFFNPAPENPDNVTCFLCQKGLDGWEAGDDPLLEHLKHAGHCGWAIVAAIDAELDGYRKEDPTLPHMVEARKATFAGRWPHEGKRGWKCKTKQLVDAGWKYTPSSESDDMATCAYCQLALDGWEQNDKPWDEHYNRAPECSFFALASQSQGTKKKAARSKASRASKASRLSTQSVATAMSDYASVADLAEPEYSVLTNATTVTQGGKKTKAKKPTKAKGKNSKAKKEDSPEIEQITAPFEDALPSSPPKPARGKKRASDAVDDSANTISEAPARKRRDTKTETSTTADESTFTQKDVDMVEAPPPKKTASRKKTRTSGTTKSARKPSGGANVSTVSLQSLIATPEDFPDDDEIERQLQEDLDRQYSDDEIARDPEPQLAKPSEINTVAGLGKSADFAMFDPAPAEAEDKAVDDELRLLEAEMEVDEAVPKVGELKIPKKSRKQGTRKVSKQTKAKRAEPASPDPLEEDARHFEPEPQPADEPQEGQDLSIGSTDTVVKKDISTHAGQAKRGRGRPAKASISSQQSSDAVGLVEPADMAEAPSKRGRGRPSKASGAAKGSKKADAASGAEPPVKRGRGRPPKASQDGQKSDGLEPSVRQEPQAPVEDDMVDIPIDSDPAEVEDSPVAVRRRLDDIFSTPVKVISPAPSAKQAAVSPSPSPQSSDAENQPPSAKPSKENTAKRVALAPVTATPGAGSPSKRNVIAGLQSSMPWTAIDLDAVLGTPRRRGDKENVVECFLKQGTELTSPEKRMTVEEWVFFNASEAENKLKHECESMVTRFESEGTKAVNVLEGLAVE